MVTPIKIWELMKKECRNRNDDECFYYGRKLTIDQRICVIRYCPILGYLADELE